MDGIIKDLVHGHYISQVFHSMSLILNFIIFWVFPKKSFWAILQKNINADCHRACDTFLKMSLDTLSI